MKYKVEYQVKELGMARPDDCVQDETIIAETAPWIPMPGDSVSMLYGEEMRGFIVLTRHFWFTGDWHGVNIVVREATSDDHLESRLKE